MPVPASVVALPPSPRIICFAPLILNGLRTRVRIESDSKLLSGRDVAISCMLGAEEFGFGTTLLMAEGCVMMRVCNLDTCPMGICTQNPELRKNFRGKPEYIINYLTFVAQELREYMAKLGVRTIDELVGRTDLLKVKPAAPGSRASKMDLDCILHNPAIENSNVHFVKATGNYTRTIPSKARLPISTFLPPTDTCA